MPTPVRIDYPGAIHHVTNRGVRGMNIFTNQQERDQFLIYLNKYQRHYEMTILGYALMPNHFHLIIESNVARLSHFMGALQSTYATWFNNRDDRESGRLFQSRFYSELIQEDSYFSIALRYVLTNPVRSGFDRNRITQWTSLSELETNDEIVEWNRIFNLLSNVQPEDFKSYLLQNVPKLESQYDEFSRNIRDMNVVGDDEFLEQILKREQKETRDGRESQTPFDPEMILQSVCEEYDFDETSELIQSVNNEDDSEARFTSYYLLKTRAHLSLSEIAKIFNISDAGVAHGLSKFEDSIIDRNRVKNFLEEWGF